MRPNTPVHGTSTMASRDRKSTRLNSSHTVISYAVFCLKKKKKKNTTVRAICCRNSAANLGNIDRDEAADGAAPHDCIHALIVVDVDNCRADAGVERTR